jgi:hypothetical protein
MVAPDVRPRPPNSPTSNKGHLNKDQLTLLAGSCRRSNSAGFAELARGARNASDPRRWSRLLMALGPPDVFIRRSYETTSWPAARRGRRQPLREGLKAASDG